MCVAAGFACVVLARSNLWALTGSQAPHREEKKKKKKPGARKREGGAFKRTATV